MELGVKEKLLTSNSKLIKGFAREYEQRKLIEEQEKMQNCYNQGELKMRLAKARVDIWYLPSLTKNDITKFEEVRKALFVDAITSLEILINTS